MEKIITQIDFIVYPQEEEIKCERQGGGGLFQGAQIPYVLTVQVDADAESIYSSAVHWMQWWC